VINCWELDSKANLVVEEIPYVRSVAIGVYIKVGSRHEEVFPILLSICFLKAQKTDRQRK